MTEYQFVVFNHQHTDIDGPEEWKIVAKSLRDLLHECEFIVTDFGPMWLSKEIEVKELYRGPSIHFEDGTYTWWYNIKGGYKKESIRESIVNKYKHEKDEIYNVIDTLWKEREKQLKIPDLHTGKEGAIMYLCTLEQKLDSTRTAQEIENKIRVETKDWPEGTYTITGFGIKGPHQTRRTES